MIRMLLSERDQVVHASRERAEESMSDLKRLLLDLFFPPRCQGCGRSGTSLCPDCKAKLPVMPRMSWAMLPKVCRAQLRDGASLP